MNSTTKKYSLILASQSPRRRELLAHLDIPFLVKTAEVDELQSGFAPQEIAVKNATLKGQACLNLCQTEEFFGDNFFPFIVAADTIVVLNSKVYGKPENEVIAREYLKDLEGKTHEVITAVYLSRIDIDTKDLINCSFSISTKVTFGKFNDSWLDQYILSKEPMDKAGAYGIQDKGLAFVQEINGSYSNVVGLPIYELSEQIASSLSAIKPRPDDWRLAFHR